MVNQNNLLKIFNIGIVILLLVEDKETLLMYLKSNSWSTRLVSLKLWLKFYWTEILKTVKCLLIALELLYLLKSVKDACVSSIMNLLKMGYSTVKK